MNKTDKDMLKKVLNSQLELWRVQGYSLTEMENKINEVSQEIFEEWMKNYFNKERFMRNYS